MPWRAIRGREANNSAISLMRKYYPQPVIWKFTSLGQQSNNLGSQLSNGLFCDQDLGDHLSSEIFISERGFRITTPSRRRLTIPCSSHNESCRLTVNSVVAVICANSSLERFISTSSPTFRPTCGSNRANSRARRCATLLVDISQKRASSSCKDFARIRIVLR